MNQNSECISRRFCLTEALRMLGGSPIIVQVEDERRGKKPAYELMDHTADFGIHVYGDNAKTLFQNAAMALMDQLVETVGLLAQEERRITIQGNDWPDLMVNWLREILYLCMGKELFVQSIQIESITEKCLTAHLWVDPLSAKRHTLRSEIKAVTYHQIQVFETGNRWEANVIFDI